MDRQTFRSHGGNYTEKQTSTRTDCQTIREQTVRKAPQTDRQTGKKTNCQTVQEPTGRNRYKGKRMRTPAPHPFPTRPPPRPLIDSFRSLLAPQRVLIGYKQLHLRPQLINSYGCDGEKPQTSFSFSFGAPMSPNTSAPLSASPNASVPLCNLAHAAQTAR